MKLSIPDWVKSTFYLNYDNAPNLTTPANKIVAIAPMVEGTTFASSKTKGITHFYRKTGVPKPDTFETIIPGDYGFNFFTPPSQAYDLGVAAANNFTCTSVVTDQLTEGGGSIPTGAYWTRAERFYKGMHTQLGCGGYNHNLLGSYVTEFNRISPEKFKTSVGGYTASPLHSYFINGLASEANARKMWNASTQSQTSEDFGFFVSQNGNPSMSTFMGLLTMGYNGFDEPDDSMRSYDIFYEIQRKYAAGINFTMLYHWIASQSLNLATDVQWRNSGWRIKRDDVQSGAYWRSQDWNVSPPHTTLFLAFIGLLLTKGIANWDGVRELYSKNVTKLKPNDDLLANNRFNWISSPSVPAPSYNTGSGDYPHRPLSTQDLYLVALDWYLKFKSKLDLGGDLRYYDYFTSTQTVNVDVTFTGDKRVFTPTVKPYGQHNILHLAHNRQGLLIGTSSGTNYAFMYFNPFANPLVTENITAKFVGSLGDVNLGSVRGREVAVFTN